MRFVFLLYGGPGAAVQPDSPELEDARAQYEVFIKQLHRRGFNHPPREMDGEAEGYPLLPASRATTVRRREGEVLVTDGPFAETREQLGGYYMVPCEDMNSALELAALLPLATRGSIEVRPLFPGMPGGEPPRLATTTSGSMRYMFLLATPEASDPPLDSPERTAYLAEWARFDERANRVAHVATGARLQPTATAKTLRIRGGHRLVTDGPYAETREQLGGYMLIDCPGHEVAVELAAQVPIVDRGSVEVRPVFEFRL